jgi:repressor LexA
LSKSYSHNVNEVLSRLKSALNADSDIAFCRIVNIGATVLANWRKREKISSSALITICEDHHLDFNWVLTGNKSDTVNEPSLVYQEHKQFLPLISIDAMAGYGVGELETVNSERYIVPEFHNKADFMIRISGTSMNPKYFHGDIVACKKIPTQTFLQWGKVYVLDTEQGALCKRVMPSKIKGNIVCRSDNSELYPEFELNWKKVRSIAIVVGVIRLE